MNSTNDPKETNILNQITIRTIEEKGAERDRFDELLQTKHYLKSSKIGGKHLRYVAEVEGEWIAIASFSGPAPQLKEREQWIGWSSLQKAKRLGMVVNNSRFLMLTERNKVPNMASKILSMCIKSLKDDWKKRWNTSILVVESFVDEKLYRGTCYRACGFEAVGMTAGFRRNKRDFYVEHGEPKQLYLRELVPNARKILKSENLPKDLEHEEVDVVKRIPLPVGGKEFQSLLEAFREMKDPRRGHGLHHRLYSTLACATVATFMGAGSYKGFEDVCKKLSQPQLRTLRCHYDPSTKLYSAPSSSTFYRALQLVPIEDFERIVATWLLKQKPDIIKRLAVDGKTLRGSGTTDAKPLMLLSAVTHQLRITIGSVAIEEKSNEIPALEPLLENLNIKGHVVTADAMHCQQKSAQLITEKHEGDYVFGLKGNQGGVLEIATFKLSTIPFTFEEDISKKNIRASKDVASNVSL